MSSRRRFLVIEPTEPGVGVIRCAFRKVQTHRIAYWRALGWAIYDTDAAAFYQVGQTVNLRPLTEWNAAAGGVQ